MANEIFKEIKTRVALRTGDYAYWTTGAGKDIELLKGEVCICTVNPVGHPYDADGNETGKAHTAPTVLFKVCNTNGQKFADLNWVSGLAADVYAWAKKETPDWSDFPKLPLEVIDNGSGKFVTDVTYADNKLTITREDAVNTLNVDNKNSIITLTVDKSKGDVTIKGEHKVAGPTEGFAGGAVTGEIDAFGESMTIKVPKLIVDGYGHTTAAEDVEYKITLPTPEAAVVTTLTDGPGINITDSATDGNHEYIVSADIGTGLTFEGTTDKDKKIAHQAKPTTGTAETATAGSGRTYVTEVLVDGLGHIAGVKTATEVDQVIDWTKVPDYETDLTITDKTDTDTENLVYAVSNLVEGGTNGHEVTATYSPLPTQKYVDDAIANAIDAIPDVVHPEYSIIKDATSEYAATYHLTKDGQNIGAAINIPKDLVVESGEVKTLEAGSPWGDAGTYIILTLANATNDKIYVNVGDLIEYVTSGSTADSQVIVTVDDNHKVTATIGAGKVTATELAKAVTDDIAKGVTAHGWGNHAEAGYAKTVDLGELATKDTITTDLIDGFEGAVKAFKIPEAFKADEADTLNGKTADDFATSAQGYMAEEAVRAAGVGLKIVTPHPSEAEPIPCVEIDTDVVFVLNCNF